MSAAATAAGYLYASGRLRGRGAREQEEAQPRGEPRKPAPRERIRVAVLPPQEKPEKARREPKIEYRVRRRWSVTP
jgi:hypothetical protein